MTSEFPARTAFAARVRAREVVVGLIVKMPNPALVEVAGAAGFDFVIIDSQHGSDDHYDLEHHLRAADSVGLASLVRIAANDAAGIGRVLDSGATGVIVPHVRSPDEATRAGAAAHYPPDGTRGLATSTRAGGHGTRSVAEHLRRSRETTVVVTQIEDADAVPLSRAIADAPNVDCIWIGPNDLGMSLGHPRSHPAVAEAEAAIADGVRRSGQAALAVLVGGPNDVRAAVAGGATVLIVVSAAVIAVTMTALLRDVRESLPAKVGTDALAARTH